MRELLLATRNPGKVRELVPLLRSANERIITLDDAAIPASVHEDLLEVHDTFEANALAKARWFRDQSNADFVLADDSGLVVDALDGAPGVRSKRWSGRNDLTGVVLDECNNQLLLSELERVGAMSASARRARYVCAAAAAWADGALVMLGTVEGVISVARSDGGHGFGYDPYFVSTELRVSFADVERDEKARVSHRGRAFRALLESLRRIHL